MCMRRFGNRTVPPSAPAVSTYRVVSVPPRMNSNEHAPVGSPAGFFSPQPRDLRDGSINRSEAATKRVWRVEHGVRWHLPRFCALFPTLRAMNDAGGAFGPSPSAWSQSWLLLRLGSLLWSSECPSPVLRALKKPILRGLPGPVFLECWVGCPPMSPPGSTTEPGAWAAARILSPTLDTPTLPGGRPAPCLDIHHCGYPAFSTHLAGFLVNPLGVCPRARSDSRTCSDRWLELGS